MTTQTLESLSPTQTLELDSGLSLTSRIKLNLTIHRSENSVKPIDEWQLKQSLINFLKSNFSITVPEEDVEIRKFKDLKKRKREDPVAHGTLFIRDLEFLSKPSKYGGGVEEGEEVLEKRYFEWRKSVVDKMDGIELSIVGVRFKLSVGVPECDDVEVMRKEWEELEAFGSRGYSRGGRRQPDTVIVRGVPSRWFAEPRVSSKPSMLVTHTIFSAFGKIRNLDVAEDDDKTKQPDEDGGDIVPGLQCKIVVRFEKYKDFYNALKVLCGRSLQKQGSRLKADYEATWDKDGFFENSRSQTEENSRWKPTMGAGNYRSNAPRHQSHHSRYSPDNERPKRNKWQVKIAEELCGQTQWTGYEF
ncbi:hypothetical protein LguiB_017381 [Lonicera macranthoides]